MLSRFAGRVSFHQGMPPALRTLCLTLLAGVLLPACGGSVSGDTEVVSDDAAPGPGDAGPGQGDDAVPSGDATPAPLATSTWLGMNVSGDLLHNDLARKLNPFALASAQKDGNGYPLAGASAVSDTDIGFMLTSGDYKISYKGTGSLAVSGIATLRGAWQSDTSTGEHRGVLAVTGTPGEFGHPLVVAISNSSGQTVTDVRIYMPGVDYDAPQAFAKQLVPLIAPFSTLRFMELQNINGSTIVEWADRTKTTQFGASAAGTPIEDLVELINATGKDMWLCIPEHASDAYITSLAQYVFANLDMARIGAARDARGVRRPFQVIVENSNETWNTGFTAYKTFLDAANAAGGYGGAYDGTYGPSWMTDIEDLMKVGRYAADRLVKIANIFRAAFGTRANQIAPVLAGWAIGPGYSDAGLRYVQQKHGDPADYFTYIAIAPYFGADDAQTDTLPHLFASANSAIQSMSATYADFATLAASYGLQMSAYEGGQGLTGITNQTIKHLAQHDKRMVDAYDVYYDLWEQHFGKALFMHFDLAGTPNVPEWVFQYGYWGSIAGGIMENVATCTTDLQQLNGSETIASVMHRCPKYKALLDRPLE